MLSSSSMMSINQVNSSERDWRRLPEDFQNFFDLRTNQDSWRINNDAGAQQYWNALVEQPNLNGSLNIVAYIELYRDMQKVRVLKKRIAKIDERIAKLEHQKYVIEPAKEIIVNFQRIRESKTKRKLLHDRNKAELEYFLGEGLKLFNSNHAKNIAFTVLKSFENNKADEFSYLFNEDRSVDVLIIKILTRISQGKEYSSLILAHEHEVSLHSNNSFSVKKEKTQNQIKFLINVVHPVDNSIQFVHFAIPYSSTVGEFKDAFVKKIKGKFNVLDFRYTLNGLDVDLDVANEKPVMDEFKKLIKDDLVEFLTINAEPKKKSNDSINRVAWKDLSEITQVYFVDLYLAGIKNAGEKRWDDLSFNQRAYFFEQFKVYNKMRIDFFNELIVNRPAVFNYAAIKKSKQQAIAHIQNLSAIVDGVNANSKLLTHHAFELIIDEFKMLASDAGLVKQHAVESDGLLSYLCAVLIHFSRSIDGYDSNRSSTYKNIIQALENLKENYQCFEFIEFNTPFIYKDQVKMILRSLFHFGNDYQNDKNKEMYVRDNAPRFFTDLQKILVGLSYEELIFLKNMMESNYPKLNLIYQNQLNCNVFVFLKHLNYLDNRWFRRKDKFDMTGMTGKEVILMYVHHCLEQLDRLASRQQQMQQQPELETLLSDFVIVDAVSDKNRSSEEDKKSDSKRTDQDDGAAFRVKNNPSVPSTSISAVSASRVSKKSFFSNFFNQSSAATVAACKSSAATSTTVTVSTTSTSISNESSSSSRGTTQPSSSLAVNSAFITSSTFSAIQIQHKTPKLKGFDGHDDL